jgi:hypothetical protein
MASCIIYFDKAKLSECAEFSFISNVHKECKKYFVVDFMNYEEATQIFLNNHSTVSRREDTIVSELKIYREEISKIVNSNITRHKVVFTFGKNNAKILSRVINRHVVNLENLGCPTLTFSLQTSAIDTQKIVSLLSLWCRQNSKRADLFTFEGRLNTFDTFPHANVNVEELANTGLFYTFEYDRTTCVVCHLVLEEWEEGEVPADEHKRWNIRCPFLRVIPDDLIRCERSYCC